MKLPCQFSDEFSCVLQCSGIMKNVLCYESFVTVFEVTVIYGLSRMLSLIFKQIFILIGPLIIKTKFGMINSFF